MTFSLLRSKYVRRGSVNGKRPAVSQACQTVRSTLKCSNLASVKVIIARLPSVKGSECRLLTSLFRREIFHPYLTAVCMTKQNKKNESKDNIEKTYNRSLRANQKRQAARATAPKDKQKRRQTKWTRNKTRHEAKETTDETTHF